MPYLKAKKPNKKDKIDPTAVHIILCFVHIPRRWSRKTKVCLCFSTVFFSELEFHSPNSFSFYDELFLKYGYSERSLAVISRAMGKPY